VFERSERNRRTAAPTTVGRSRCDGIGRHIHDSAQINRLADRWLRLCPPVPHAELYVAPESRVIDPMEAQACDAIVARMKLALGLGGPEDGIQARDRRLPAVG